MKIKAFFEKFEQIADAPNAVEKMRELVLRKAVSGGLSGSQADQWMTVKVEHLTEIQNGFAFKSNYFNQVAHGMPLIRIRDLASESTEAFYTGEYRDEFVVKKGDFLIGMDGNFNIHRWNGPDALLNQRVCRLLNFTADIYPDFLFFAIQEHLDEIHRNTTFTTVKHISAKQIRDIAFPLPPLAEQKRIVAKVDELMALCDRLEAQQEERDTRYTTLARASLTRFVDAPTPANLDFLFHKCYAITPADLRKSILTLAVQGKLVPQDPNDEPAEVIVDRVVEFRQKFFSGKRVKATKRIRELDVSQYDHDIPMGWAWCRLGDLVLDFRYGTSRKCGRDVRGVPVLRIPNVQNGMVDATDLKFTDMPPSEFEELRLQEGDLLLVRSNGSESLVGRSAVATADDERFAYAGYLVRARIPCEVVFAPYLHAALSTPSVRNQIEGPIRTTSGVKNINTTELSNLVLPLPPFAEQRRIVAKVDQLMALVDQLETQLTTSRATAARLMEAVVAELTTQGGEVAA